MRGLNRGGSASRGLQSVTKTTRKVGVIQVEVGVAEEVGGGMVEDKAAASQ